MDTKAAITALGALAQRSRLEVFRLLVRTGPDGLPAGEIARHLGVPSNTMSTHLALLEQAGLVTSRRAGRSIIYSANFAGMRALLTFLSEDCCQRRPEICGPLVTHAGGDCRAPAAEAAEACCGPEDRGHNQ